MRAENFLTELLLTLILGLLMINLAYHARRLLRRRRHRRR